MLKIYIFSKATEEYINRYCSSEYFLFFNKIIKRIILKKKPIKYAHCFNDVNCKKLKNENKFAVKSYARSLYLILYKISTQKARVLILKEENEIENI